ncbi:MAG: diguanylate cyclase [Halomonadaceae bacterium]|nr:MAG: diguanylate cyclase [Halomonadaceae bacterium]
MTSADWKQKYLQQLDENERQLGAWQGERYSLQRLLVRVSLLAEGQDPALDRLLEQLRSLARQEVPDTSLLLQLQEQLDEQVNGFDEGRRQLLQDLQQVIQRLSASLHPRAAKPERGALNQFDQALKGRLAQVSEWPRLLEELADLQEQVLALDTGAPVSGSKVSLLNRLLGRESPRAPEPVSPRDHRVDPDAPGADPGILSGPDDGLDLAAVASPFHQRGQGTGEATGESGIVRALAHRLGQLLQQLLQQPGISDGARQRMAEMQKRAQSSIAWPEVRQLLDEMGHLIAVAMGHSQRQFAGFLTTLDQSLGRLQSQFKGDALGLESRRTLATRFDQQFHTEIDALDENVAAATELAQLQQATREHLTRLNSTLVTYREAESQREDQLQAEVAQLQARLKEMESESLSMQEELARQRTRASTDLLTQLPNRDALEERLQQEFDRWQRYHHDVCLAVVDIDHFKSVNDNYGHLAGDRVLQLVARCLRDNLRGPDFVARFGGEEFVVLLPETGPEDALLVMNKVRERVARLPFHFRQQQVRLTVSAGLLAFQPVANLSELFDIADRALYRAKAEGRDRVVLATQDQGSPGTESG